MTSNALIVLLVCEWLLLYNHGLIRENNGVRVRLGVLHSNSESMTIIITDNCQMLRKGLRPRVKHAIGVIARIK